MNIYFIRHGETAYNRKRIHQHENVPLSELGREQARKTGERLKELPITKLISSDLLRAYESAEIIAQTTGLELELNTIFREVQRPSKLYGLHHYTPLSLLIGAQMLGHLGRRSWHHSDEENLYDIRRRVHNAADYLKEIGKEHEHVAIVSHAFILNMFIKYMCEYKGVRIRDYLATLFAAKRLHNASVTTLAFNEDGNSHTCDWLCLKVNDTSHL